ncbi:hypothetical protein TNCV_2258921 [Trichonephila clavipes]|nr:hypothetical protein TNCV_2258921 [Trichonephila clavipes]
MLPRGDRDMYPIAPHTITPGDGPGSHSNGLLTESSCCCKRRRTDPADTCCLANDLNSQFRARDVRHDSLRPCDERAWLLGS